MSRSLWPSLALALITACGPTADDSDAGTLDSGPLDAGQADAGPVPVDSGSPDAGGDGCIQAQAGAFDITLEDDVSVQYGAAITPALDGSPHRLELRFYRYDLAYVGTFDLSEGQDSNFGSCARCVVAFGGLASEGFFAAEGSLTLREDPFHRRLDATISGLRLVQVTIENQDGVPTSVPVEGGLCVTFDEITIPPTTFPPSTWSCAADDYRDGETCDCACGAYDPDCDETCDLSDPGCDPFNPPPPLPRAGCEEGEICGTAGRCLEPCDRTASSPCSAGTCAPSREGDRCFLADEPFIDPAALGEFCASDGRIRYCGVTDGVAQGQCDEFSNYQCRAFCESVGDCNEGETCEPFEIGVATGACYGPPKDG